MYAASTTEIRKGDEIPMERIKTVPPFPAALTPCAAAGSAGTGTITGNPEYKL